jgi:hypothetical protein
MVLMVCMALTVGHLLPASEAAAPVSLLSYVQHTADGSYIDWYLGRAGAMGQTLVYRKNYDSNKLARLQTINDAETDGQRRLLQMLGDLTMRDGAQLRTVPAVMSGLTPWVDSIKGTVQSESSAGLRTTMVIPMWGGAGPDGDPSVMKSVLDPIVGKAGPGKEREAATEPPAGDTGEVVSGLIIDATAIKDAAPALFPRLLDESGVVLYSFENVESDFAYFRGMAAYAVRDPSNTPQPPVLYPREGHHPMIVTAVGVSGATRGDLILSREDGAKVAAAAASATFLKECRVLVLMSPPPPLPRGQSGQQVHRPRPQPLPSPLPAGDPNMH